MSDYTPETSDVRANYVDGTRQLHGKDMRLEDVYAEFDRWLYEERNRMASIGAGLERERIIKLLEALTTHDLCMLGEHHEDWVNNNTRGIIEVLTEWDSEPVALIKGENK